MPDFLNKQEFVAAEVVWLIEGCLTDLREAAANPANAKYEALLATCETTSSLIARFAPMQVVQDASEAARSAPEIPFEQVVLICDVLSGECSHCDACGGWRPKD